MTGQPQARSSALIIQELPGELLVYDLTRHKALCLNETAAEVWRRCDGERSVNQIVSELTLQWDSPVSEDVVWLALERLGDAKLLDRGAELPAKKIGIGRREMILRIKAASIIAVPLVTSILVPTALAAVSALPAGASCLDGAVCASRVCIGASPGPPVVPGTCM